MHHNTENNMTCLQRNMELTNCALSHLLKKKQQENLYKINKLYQSAVKGSVILAVLF
jgi:hypothetical protein